MTMRAGEIRRARRWRLTFLGLVALCLATVAADAALGDVTPDDAWGLGYGIAASALLGLAMAYALRRRGMGAATRWRLGSAQTWLRLHVYGGLLFALLVLMHSGFRLPLGLLTGALWSLSLVIVASGLLGLLLQRWLPRVLAEVEIEILAARIPDVCEELEVRAHRLLEKTTEPLRSLVERELIPRLGEPRRRWQVLVGNVAESRWSELEYVRALVPVDQLDELEEAVRLGRAKTAIDAHYTLQRVLRGWLALHVPLSIALVVLLVAHVGTVIFF